MSAATSESGLKFECGWWMPQGERHMNEWMRTVGVERDGRLMYQGHKLDAALKWCARRRTALDIGAHIGTWSYYLAAAFERVYAWEPVELHRRCYWRNVLDVRGNVELFDCALGEERGEVVLETSEESSGDTRVAGSSVRSGRQGAVPMKTLDDFIGSVEGHVDLVKVDCEGYEYLILRGGEEMIVRNKPVVVVEQKPGKGKFYGLGDTSAVTYLKQLGATVRAEISGDFILSWG